MGRRLIATFLAFLVIITGVAAAPARAASDDEIGRALAGVVTLYIIGSALSDLADNRSAGRASGSRGKANAVTAPRWDEDRDRRYFPSAQRREARYLPSECFFTIRRGKRETGVFGKTCLNEIMRRPARLPRACLETYRPRHGRAAQVYEARCLRERGWEMERPRRRH